MTSGAIDRISPFLRIGLNTSTATFAGVHSHWLFREKKTEMKTCLVVDDTSVIRKIARNILGEVDFQVAEAAHGEQAVGKLAPKVAAMRDL
jgi:PleD family two-component response regulator